jgi:hypothetical protein
VNRFRDAVVETQPMFEGATHASYITHVDRLDEADLVEPCIERAVYGELDPTGHRALGRLTKLSPPGLAEYLTRKKRYRNGDPVVAEAIGAAARSVMALGWLFCCHPEAEMADRSARDIWDFWAGPSLRDSLGDVAGKPLARLIHNSASTVLANMLREAGLKRRGPSKVDYVAMQMSQNGFYLRMTQTTEINDDVFLQAVSSRRETGIGSADGRWDWDAYPVGKR